jgi:hypothetical protein
VKKGSNRVKTRRIHELELRKHRWKVQDQQRELAQAREKNARLSQSLETLGQVHTAILAAVALKFGTQTGRDTVELVVPAVDVSRLMQTCQVTWAKTGTGESVIRIQHVPGPTPVFPVS